MSLLVKADAYRGRMETFGFEYLGFRTESLEPGERYEETTGTREVAVVLLGGVCSVTSSAGDFSRVGGRSGVFGGLPHTVYLPIETEFRLTAETACDLAFCYSKAEEAYAAAVVGPEDVRVEIRGGGNATRQINHMLQPGFAAHRILICEVYTPGGNWSSYPPHKHDVHNPPGEVDLEEIYYYRIDRPEGYAIQTRVHQRRTDRRNAHGAGWRVGAGAGGLSSRGGGARVQRLLSERAGRVGAVDGRVGRPPIRVGAGDVARARSATAPGEVRCRRWTS